MNRKVAVITGASSGIGKALAYTFAAKNFDLAICARRDDLLNDIANDIISKHSVDVYVFKADISMKDEAESFVKSSIEKFNRIDVLINNAGISQRSLFEETDLIVFERLIGVNYWGAVYCVKFSLPYILESKGSIIAISSISGYTPLPARTAYASSKYALHGFLESLRIELLKKGVNVLVATPSFTESEIRIKALTHEGDQQGFSPKDENKLMTAEYVAEKVYKAYLKKKRTLVLPSFIGNLFIKFYQLLPKIADKFIYTQMKKEKDTPLN